MNIVPKDSKAPQGEVRKKEQKEKTKLKKVGHIVPHKGHTLYEIHLKTLEWKKAEFEKQDYVVGQKKQPRKVIIQKHCTYIMALNEKNFKKKVLKRFGIKL